MKLSLNDFKKYVPIATWLPKYQRSLLRADVIAGITVWGVVVPSAMADAGLAGMPPQTGLYAAFAGLLAFAIFSTSKHVKVSATATAAVMSAAVVSGLNPGGDFARYAALSAMMALLVGGIIVAVGSVRLGFISEFISKPVITGFLFGVGIDIIVRQAPKLFGIPGGSGNVFERTAQLIMRMGDTNLWTLGIGLVSLVLIFTLRRYIPRIPGPLVALVLGILISSTLKLTQQGVSVVGSIPNGLPSLTFPAVNISDLSLLLAEAGGLVFLTIGETISLSRGFAARHNYDIDPDQDLIALGVANLSSGLFQGFTIGASKSPTLTGDQAGAETQLSSIVSSILVVATLVFLAPFFTTLPNAVLAAVVISAVSRLLDVKAMKEFFRDFRKDFLVALIALLGVITVDLVPGLLIAVFLSIIMVVYVASRPHLAVLGADPSRPHIYSDSAHHPENNPIPGLLIVRMDSPLFFANANITRSQVRNAISMSSPPPKAVLFDISTSAGLDFTSLDMLKNLFNELEAAKVEVILADVRTPVYAKLERAGLLDKIGKDHVFLGVDGAVQDFLHRHPASTE